VNCRGSRSNQVHKLCLLQLILRNGNIFCQRHRHNTCPVHHGHFRNPQFQHFTGPTNILPSLFQEMTKLFVGAMKAEDTVVSFDGPDSEAFRMPLSMIPSESTFLAQADDFSDMLQYRADWIGDTNNNTQPSQNKSFATMLNELSVNVSLSLMSSPSLW
jgi:hypothetical protein